LLFFDFLLELLDNFGGICQLLVLLGELIIEILFRLVDLLLELGLELLLRIASFAFII
jgi:hypothetical protein